MGLVAKAFQDIITFSRGSPGWYTDSNGYITRSAVSNYLGRSNEPENALWTKSNSFVQQNLLTYSQEFDNAAWVKNQAGVAVVPVVTANQGTAPDGTLTADRIQLNCVDNTSSANRCFISPLSISHPSGLNYTASIYVKAFDASNVGKTIRFAVDGLSSIVYTLTADWQRITITGLAATTVVNFLIETRGTFTGQTADLLMWGAQLVQGSVPGDYRATTSAALPCLYADYNGALRARKLCENNATGTHSVQQTPTITSGAVYTFSAYVKAGERTWAVVQLHSAIWAYVNLATGAVGTTSGSPSVSVVPLTNGYWRVSVTSTVVAASASNVVYPATSDGGVSYTGDGSSGIYIADAQLNEGSSALAYWDNATGLATYAPRFDYDPVTLAAKGLLIEESRANLLTYSNDFSNAAWTKNTITVTATSALSPDGTVNGWLLTNTGVGGRVTNFATATATSHSYSAFTKAGTASTVTYLLYNQTTATVVAQGDMNLSTGVVSPGIGTMVSTPAGNGWYRATITATTGITIGNALIVYIYPGGSSGAIGATIYAYGAQLEQGAFATSYIPTGISQVTRAADVASVNTLSPWFNSVAGTVYAQFDSFGPSTTVFSEAALIAIYPGGNDGFVSMGIDNITTPTTFGGTYLGSATFQASFTATNGTWYTPNKIANSYKLNDFAFSSNGAAAVVDTSGTLPTLSATHALVIGSFGSSRFINGHIQRITYYPRRLTNAELQTLTTL